MVVTVMSMPVQVQMDSCGGLSGTDSQPSLDFHLIGKDEPIQSPYCGTRSKDIKVDQVGVVKQMSNVTSVKLCLLTMDSEGANYT